MSKDFQISGIRFNVYTVLDGGHYYGKWVCMDDGATGASDKRCGSEEEALKFGQNNAEHYFGFKYGETLKKIREDIKNESKDKNDA